ncbi:MAG: tetraacyldisaccharide 4'-kinase [Planctomycetaceae bacterium]|nr:tetraacyldisaccharide 4'-kinase [Planctomycetaceae bacterium]
MTIWLAQWFLQQGKRPGIVSRGYHADETGWNDEAKEIRMLLPDVPQAFSKNRFKAATSLLSQHPVDLILLDDGFQHRKLFRDIDIVLLDATNEFGYNRVFPRGLLRENIASLKRADIVLLSRADAVDAAKRADVRKQVYQIAPDVLWGEFSHVPVSLLDESGQTWPVDFLKNHKLLAFCGLGNPQTFRSTLLSCGYHFQELIVYPDHHIYTKRDAEALQKKAEQTRSHALICSLKDYVKILSHSPDFAVPVYALVIGVQMASDFSEILKNHLFGMTFAYPIIFENILKLN